MVCVELCFVLLRFKFESEKRRQKGEKEILRDSELWHILVSHTVLSHVLSCFLYRVSLLLLVFLYLYIEGSTESIREVTSRY